MKTVQEGDGNTETNAEEVIKINLTDATEEEMKEKFAKVAALIEDFKKGSVQADALEKFSKISALIEEYLQNRPCIAESRNEDQQSTRESKVHTSSPTEIADAEEKVSQEEILKR